MSDSLEAISGKLSRTAFWIRLKSGPSSFSIAAEIYEGLSAVRAFIPKPSSSRDHRGRSVPAAPVLRAGGGLSRYSGPHPRQYPGELSRLRGPTLHGVQRHFPSSPASESRER